MPGKHLVSLVVEGNLPRQALRQLGPLRPRAHDAHLSLEDVERLGDLVQPRPSQQLPQRGDPRVLLLRRGVVVAVHPHGPELQDGEAAAILPEPFLAEQDGTRALQLDGGADDRPEGQAYQEQHHGHQNVHGALERLEPPAAARPYVLQEPASRDDAERHLLQGELVEAGQRTEPHALRAVLQQPGVQRVALLVSVQDDDGVPSLSDLLQRLQVIPKHLRLSAGRLSPLEERTKAGA